MSFFLRMSFTVIEWKALSEKPMQYIVMFSFCRVSSMCRFWLLQLEPDMQESSYNISTKSINSYKATKPGRLWCDLTLSDANHICFWLLWPHLKVDISCRKTPWNSIAKLPHFMWNIFKHQFTKNQEREISKCQVETDFQVDILWHVLVFFLHILDILILWRWSPNVLHHRRVSRLKALRRVFGEAAEFHQFGQVSAT